MHSLPVDRLANSRTANTLLLTVVDVDALRPVRWNGNRCALLWQVVLIGDGFAEGLGDWVVMGGMAGVARQLQLQAGTDDKVREGLSWLVVFYSGC